MKNKILNIFFSFFIISCFPFGLKAWGADEKQEGQAASSEKMDTESGAPDPSGQSHDGPSPLPSPRPAVRNGTLQRAAMDPDAEFLMDFWGSSKPVAQSLQEVRSYVQEKDTDIAKGLKAVATKKAGGFTSPKKYSVSSAMVSSPTGEGKSAGGRDAPLNDLLRGTLAGSEHGLTLWTRLYGKPVTWTVVVKQVDFKVSVEKHKGSTRRMANQLVARHAYNNVLPVNEQFRKFWTPREIAESIQITWRMGRSIARSKGSEATLANLKSGKMTVYSIVNQLSLNTIEETEAVKAVFSALADRPDLQDIFLRKVVKDRVVAHFFTTAGVLDYLCQKDQKGIGGGLIQHLATDQTFWGRELTACVDGCTKMFSSIKKNVHDFLPRDELVKPGALLARTREYESYFSPDMRA